MSPSAPRSTSPPKATPSNKPAPTSSKPSPSSSKPPPPPKSPLAPQPKSSSLPSKSRLGRVRAGIPPLSGTPDRPLGMSNFGRIGRQLPVPLRILFRNHLKHRPNSAPPPPASPSTHGTPESTEPRPPNRLAHSGTTRPCSCPGPSFAVCPAAASHLAWLLRLSWIGSASCPSCSCA